METVLPVNTSVSSFGFYGPSGENVWCLTNVETLRQVLIAVCSVLGEFGVSSLAHLFNQSCSSLSVEVGDEDCMEAVPSSKELVSSLNSSGHSGRTSGA